MSNSGYVYALDALRFFCHSGTEQVESLKRATPENAHFFFSEQKITDEGCEYFYGIGCIFLTYVSGLYDKFLSSTDAGQLQDFHHILNVRLSDGASEWSATAAV